MPPPKNLVALWNEIRLTASAACIRDERGSGPLCRLHVDQGSAAPGVAQTRINPHTSVVCRPRNGRTGVRLNHLSDELAGNLGTGRYRPGRGRLAGCRQQPALVIDDHDAARPAIAPSPEHEIQITRLGRRRKAANTHADETGRDQPIGQRLRCRNHAAQHAATPTTCAQFEIGHTVRLTHLRVHRVENRFGIDLIGAQRDRLESASGEGLADGGQRRQGQIEGGQADAVESASIAASPLARIGATGIGGACALDRRHPGTASMRQGREHSSTQPCEPPRP